MLKQRVQSNTSYLVVRKLRQAQHTLASNPHSLKERQHKVIRINEVVDLG